MAKRDKIAERIVKWLGEKVHRAGADGVVLGMSGGLDSSVVAILCKKAFPENSIALIMPCESDPEDAEDAETVVEKIGIECKKIELSNAFREMLKALGGPAGKVTDGNLKARLRMCTLYFYANNLNYLVMGSGNKSELSLGYFTKHGDGAADLFPLGNLLKSEVAELAGELGVPEKIIKKKPSAGLWKGQTDEEDLGMTYETIDRALGNISGETGNKTSEKMGKIKKMVAKNRHKTQAPEMFCP